MKENGTAYVAVYLVDGQPNGMNVYLPGVPCERCSAAEFRDPMFNEKALCTRARGHASLAVEQWGSAVMVEVGAATVEEARARVVDLLARLRRSEESKQPPAAAGGYKLPKLPSGYTWRDGQSVKFHANDVYATAPGRRIVEGDWPAARPEECQDTSGQGVWIEGDGASVLICPGCGIDCT